MHEGTFTVDDLSALRRLAAEHGRRAGLGPSRLSDFVLAVSEAATSAVCHGGQRGRLRLWVSGDGAAGISAGPNPARPDDTDSLRLWVVWHVCSEVSLTYGPDETTVLLWVSDEGNIQGTRGVG